MSEQLLSGDILKLFAALKDNIMKTLNVATVVCWKKESNLKDYNVNADNTNKVFVCQCENVSDGSQIYVYLSNDLINKLINKTQTSFTIKHPDNRIIVLFIDKNFDPTITKVVMNENEKLHSIKYGIGISILKGAE